jgi:hypothetical protein
VGLFAYFLGNPGVHDAMLLPERVILTFPPTMLHFEQKSIRKRFNIPSLPTSILANNKDCFHKGSYQLTGATFFDRKINGWEFG